MHLNDIDFNEKCYFTVYMSWGVNIRFKCSLVAKYTFLPYNIPSYFVLAFCQ